MQESRLEEENTFPLGRGNKVPHDVVVGFEYPAAALEPREYVSYEA